MKFCTTTIESGSVYRACEFTGEERTVETASIFSGPGKRTDKQVRAWNITHPDDPHTESAPSPYGKEERPVGIGEYVGLEWIPA